jgi:hypothetical protein
MVKEADNGEVSTCGFERRKHPRVPVSVSVLCDSLDLEGNPRELYTGAIKEVSPTGLAIELFSVPAAEQVLLSFIDFKNRDVQIKAKVVHSRINSFMARVGLSFAGSAAEIDRFVSQVLRTHHSVPSTHRHAQSYGS